MAKNRPKKKVSLPSSFPPADNKKKIKALKDKTAMDTLEESVQERAQEQIDVGKGVQVSRLVMGLGDGDPNILKRRQFVLEWYYNGKVHPEAGRLSITKLSDIFQVSEKTIKKDIDTLRGGMIDMFSGEEMQDNLLLMAAKVLHRIDDNMSRINETMSKVDRAIDFLEDSFGNYLHTYNGKPKAVQPKDIPKEIRDQFSDVKSISLAQARNSYNRLLVLRNQTADRMMKSTREGLDFIKTLTGGASGGEGSGNTLNLTLTQDNRSVEVGSGGDSPDKPITREDLIEMTQNPPVTLPVGLETKELEKESTRLYQDEEDEKLGKK